MSTVRKLLLFPVRKNKTMSGSQELIMLYSSLSNSIGVLILCEVAAKPFHEENNSNYGADQACKANKKL